MRSRPSRKGDRFIEGFKCRVIIVFVFMVLPFFGFECGTAIKKPANCTVLQKTENPPSISVKRNNVTELLLLNGPQWRRLNREGNQDDRAERTCGLSTFRSMKRLLN